MSLKKWKGRGLQTWRRARFRIRFTLTDPARGPKLTPLFICGVSGSGTSLVSFLIDERLEVAGMADESAIGMPNRGSPVAIRGMHKYADVDAFLDALRIPPHCDASTIRGDLSTFHHARNPAARPGVVVDKAPNAHLMRAKHLREAFPDAVFLMLVREPLSAIEGLVRKWNLFQRAGVAGACRFWTTVHSTFLEDTASFQDEVLFIAYDQLVSAPDQTIARIAERVGLEFRAIPKKRPDKPNRPGFHVRNIVDGQIEVVKDASARAKENLSDEAKALIRENARPLYDRMLLQFSD